MKASECFTAHKTYMLNKPSNKALQLMWYAPTIKPVQKALTKAKEANI
jgi:hypothetical protein